VTWPSYDLGMAVLKTYVYISETKVKMLYDQIEEQERSTSKEVGIDIKFFKAGIKTDVAPRTTLISKLNRVMDVLTDGAQIGSLQQPKQYVSGAMKMKWGTTGYDMALFVGKVAGTIVLLGGSEVHLIGESGVPEGSLEAPRARPTSAMPPIFRHMRELAKTLKAQEGAGSRTTSASSSGGALGSVESVEERQELIENSLLVADKFRAPTQALEFVARQYVLGKSEAAPRTKVLIGSPIYVALAE
jgi:hypothetical protein